MPRSICPFVAFVQLQLAVLLGATAIGSESFGSDGAATLIVTSTADSGAGSLRQALADANDGDTIQFDAALNGQTITLTSDELVIDSDITINGPGPHLLRVAKTPSIPPRFRIFRVMPGHTVLIEGLTISGGYSDGKYAGGILNDQATLTISNCIVSGNFCDAGPGGGGIVSGGTLTIINSIVTNNGSGFTSGFPVGDGGGILGGGTMTIIHSTITNNSATFNGGGIYLGTGTITIIDSTVGENRAGSNLNGSGIGGGIYYIGGSGSTLRIENSTISGNTANGNGSGVGGGIVSSGMLAITNSTFSGNFANQDGGGILSNGPLTITNSTFSDNRANRYGGGIINYAGLEIENTILKTGTSGGNIFNSGGTVTSLGYNLSSDNGGGFLTAAGDQINTNPMLGPLQNNGGPTLTHLPLPGSLAINAGDPDLHATAVHGSARVRTGLQRTHRRWLGGSSADAGADRKSYANRNTHLHSNCDGDTTCNANPDIDSDFNPDCNRYSDADPFTGPSLKYLDPAAGRNREQRDDWWIYHHR